MLAQAMDPILDVRDSPLHGRGIFARTRCPKGSRLGTFPLLILTGDDTRAIRYTKLYNYLFYVDEDDNGAMRGGIAFGFVSMCNHSAEPNADFEIDIAACQVRLTARRDIDEDEEILIDYGDFASEVL